MYCGQCGNKLQEHSGQCGNCGKLVGQTVKAKTTPINLKKWGIIIVVGIMAIFFLPKLFGSGADMSSPKGTVTGFIKAAKKQDVDKMYKFFLPDDNMIKSDLAYFKDQYEEMIKEQSIKIKDYKILEVDIDGKEAIVDYMVQIKYEGNLETTEDSFDLVKVGKKWYIDENLFDF